MDFPTNGFQRSIICPSMPPSSMTVINRLPRFDLQELPSSAQLSVLALHLRGGRTST